MSSHRYFIVYKPYNMLSQFVSPFEQRRLGDLNFEFPPGTNAVGRLDIESEGLLILTTDKSLSRKLLLPHLQHERTYIVQVAQKVSEQTLLRLSEGVSILLKGKGEYITQPCKAELISEPPGLLNSSIFVHENASTSWLKFTLTEGKNRQIRKMCRAVGHRCLRLIRVSIADLNIDGMFPGEVREIHGEELYSQLFPNSYKREKS